MKFEIDSVDKIKEEHKLEMQALLNELDRQQSKFKKLKDVLANNL
jgi:hypothetical protein